jgi:hypothetical protein
MKPNFHQQANLGYAHQIYFGQGLFTIAKQKCLAEVNYLRKPTADKTPG